MEEIIKILNDSVVINRDKLIRNNYTQLDAAINSGSQLSACRFIMAIFNLKVINAKMFCRYIRGGGSVATIHLNSFYWWNTLSINDKKRYYNSYSIDNEHTNPIEMLSLDNIFNIWKTFQL